MYGFKNITDLQSFNLQLKLQRVGTLMLCLVQCKSIVNWLNLQHIYNALRHHGESYNCCLWHLSC